MSAVTTVARVAVLRAIRRSSTWTWSALAFAPALVGALLGARGHDALADAGPLLLALVGPMLVISAVASPLGDSFAQRTIGYYFMRPVSRPSVLLGEFAGLALVAAGVMAAGGALLAVANAVTSGGGSLSTLASVPLGAALEGVVLVALSVGAATLAPRHPVSVTLGALAGLELLGWLWGPLQRVSVVRSAAHVAGVSSEIFSRCLTGAAPEMSTPWAAAVLAVTACVPLALASMVVVDRDLT